MPRNDSMKDNTPMKDVQLLARADAALSYTTPRVRRATLEYLWDKWVINATPTTKLRTKRGRSDAR